MIEEKYCEFCKENTLWIIDGDKQACYNHCYYQSYPIDDKGELYFWINEVEKYRTEKQ